MKQITLQLKNSLLDGLKAGLKTGFWISKMMVPITLCVALLEWVGVIAVFSEFVAPAFKVIGLTGEGVIVFMTTALASLYPAIALIAVFDMDYRTTTILAVMGLVCHNLIMETVIQRKSGASGWFIVVLRLAVALLAGYILNLIIPQTYSGELTLPQVPVAEPTLWGTLEQWGWQMIQLLPYLFMIVLSLNILQQILRNFNLIQYLTIPLLPLMKLFGLSRESSFLWIILNTLGLAYGGSVLINEIKQGEIPKKEAKLLNTHAAINHSLLEDTLIFITIGLNLFWLVVPRVILATAAVWIHRLFLRNSK